MISREPEAAPAHQPPAKLDRRRAGQHLKGWLLCLCSSRAVRRAPDSVTRPPRQKGTAAEQGGRLDDRMRWEPKGSPNADVQYLLLV